MESFSSRSLVVLMAFVFLIGFVASTIFRGMFLAYISSFYMYEYSYMYVLVPLLLFVLLDMLLNYFDPVGLSIDRLLLSLGMYFSSLLFFLIYRFYSEGVIQYGVVAFIFLVWSFLVLIYRPISVKYYFVVVFLMLLFIPPPLSWINYLSTNLSYMMGYLAAVLVGAEAKHVGDSFYVWIVDSVGNRRLFEITFACSGVISLTSVLSVLPFITYFIMRVDADLRVKIKAFLLSILVSTGITLLGNLLRLIIIFLVTRFYSYDLAMVIFHQSPSMIYVVLAIVSGFYVLWRIVGDKLWFFKKESIISTRRTLFDHVLVAGFIVLLVMSIGYGSVVNGLSTSAAGKSIILPSVDTLIANPLLTIFNGTGVRVLKNEPAPYLTTVLGSSIVREITIVYNDRVYSGYLEIAETPSRMHGWYVCLTFQGYKILKSWSIRDNVVVNYMLISKNNRVSLLAYATFRLLALFGNTTQPVYVRLSLFTPASIRNYENQVFVFKELFQKVSRNAESLSSSSVAGVFENIVYLVNGFIVLNLVLVVLGLGKNKLYRSIKAITRRR